MDKIPQNMCSVHIEAVLVLGNLMSYIIQDSQSKNDLGDYTAFLIGEIVGNIIVLRILVPIWFVCQKKGFRQFMKYALDDFMDYALDDLC